MKRPKKIYFDDIKSKEVIYCTGYNQACDDHTPYIEHLKKKPSVEWLRKFFEEYFGCHDEITKEHHVGSLPQDLHDRLNKE